MKRDGRKSDGKIKGFLTLNDSDLPETAPPLRALIISALALLVAASAALFRFENLEETWGLLWVLALIPPFLLSYYRGWSGGVAALGIGMVVLTGTELGAGLILGEPVNWWIYGIASVTLISVSLGVGISNELLHRTGGDPNRARRRQRRTSELSRALESGELQLHYQPVVSFKNGRVSGAEALVRWDHPERGLIAPDDFLPTAEETGLIVPLGRWVLEQACKHYSHWRDRFTGGNRFFLSVNLSLNQCLEDDDLPDITRRALAESGLHPGRLHLEIGERGLQEAIPMLSRLKETGVRLLIDDFGTAHASLSYSDQVEVDGIKIQQSLLPQMEDGDKFRSLLWPLIELADSLGMTVTAKGIETKKQFERFKGVGCDYGQGYYFARPLAVTESVREMEAIPSAGSRA